jgi:hypothetical protein
VHESFRHSCVRRLTIRLFFRSDADPRFRSALDLDIVRIIEAEPQKARDLKAVVQTRIRDYEAFYDDFGYEISRQSSQALNYGNVNPPFTRTALLLVALVSTSSAFAAGERNNFNPLQFSTGAFHGCQSIGNGSDPYLNSLKNRDIRPTGGKLRTVTQLLNELPTLLQRKIHRSNWTAQQQDLAAKWESRAFKVEGYLVGVTKEDKEACNCGSGTDVDHHLWLAARPSYLKARAMVVEVSPRLWPMHPSWANTKTFQKLIDAKKKVRIAGWLTWDQEHPEQLKATQKRQKTRMTLWEIHPVHEIEVKSGNQWVSL